MEERDTMLAFDGRERHNVMEERAFDGRERDTMLAFDGRERHNVSL